MIVIVYIKFVCVQCSVIFKVLDKQGIVYQKVDISLDFEVWDYVMVLGYL